MKFGKKLRQLRRARGELLQVLARRAGYSSATLSQIERGKFIPIEDTAKKIIALLDVDDKTRKQLLNALEHDRVELQEKKHVEAGLEFGDTLRSLLDRLKAANELKSINAELIRRTGRPASSVNAWVAGTLLPSAETFVMELLPHLKALGASRVELRELQLTHFHDLAARCLNIPYWTEDNQRELLDSLVEKARRILLPPQEGVELPTGARRFKKEL